MTQAQQLMLALTNAETAFVWLNRMLCAAIRVVFTTLKL